MNVNKTVQIRKSLVAPLGSWRACSIVTGRAKQCLLLARRAEARSIAAAQEEKDEQNGHRHANKPEQRPADSSTGGLFRVCSVHKWVFAGEHEFALCHLIASATGSLQRPEARDVSGCVRKEALTA